MRRKVWRNTTLLIMYGLLHANLPRTPRDKPVSVREVKDFLDKVILSRNFAEETIRSHMKEIDEMIDELQRELDQAGKEDRAATQRN